MPIDLSMVRPLSGLAFRPEPLPLELRLNAIEAKPPRAADIQPDPIYATVKVGGEVVATLHASGAAVTRNADAARLRALPSMGEAETLTGVPLAQKRAEEIARTLGGVIERATAPSAAPVGNTNAAGRVDPLTLIHLQMLRSGR